MFIGYCSSSSMSLFVGYCSSSSMSLFVGYCSSSSMLAYWLLQLQFCARLLVACLINVFTADNVNNTFCILLKYLPRTYTYAGATLLVTTALDKHKIYIYLSAKYELCTYSCYSIQTRITLQTWQMRHKQCMDYGTERVNLPATCKCM